MFSVPDTVLRQASKCRHEYSCLVTGHCGDTPMCQADTLHGSNVLCVRSAGSLSCHYHLDFGGAGFCVCPVRCAIHEQTKS